MGVGGGGDAANAFLRAFLTLLMLFSECDGNWDVVYFVTGVAGALLLMAAAAIKAHNFLPVIYFITSSHYQ